MSETLSLEFNKPKGGDPLPFVVLEQNGVKILYGEDGNLSVNGYCGFDYTGTWAAALGLKRFLDVATPPSTIRMEEPQS